MKFLDRNMPELNSIMPSIEKPRILYKKESASLYNNRLKSIDRFLQVLIETPELWTRDILIFLGIDKGSDQTIYLQKRAEHLQRKNKGINSEDSFHKGNPLDLPIEDSSSELSFR